VLVVGWYWGNPEGSVNLVAVAGARSDFCPVPRGTNDDFLSGGCTAAEFHPTHLRFTGSVKLLCKLQQ